MRFLRALPTLAVCLCLASCESPIPCGPGGTQVALEGADVIEVDSGLLSPQFRASQGDTSQPKRRWALRMRARADLDLNRYFEGWQVQTRCSVEGAADGRNYSTPATPYLTSSLEDGSKDAGGLATLATKRLPFAFTLYAFVDLDAQDDEYSNGRPRGSLNLRTASFERLSCYLRGVSMAPALYPRTSALTVSEGEFQALLRAAAQ